MKLARYAPEDLNSNKKKQKCFRRGLNSSLQEQMVTHIYPNFNTLMNCTILLEEERIRGEGEWKRKFLIQRARQQERTQRVHTNNTAPTRYQPTMQYSTSRTNTSQTTSNYKNNSNNSNNNNNNPPKSTNNTTMETYFGCQQLGHRVAQCPLKAANSTPTHSISSNKAAASGTRRSAPQNSRLPRRNALNFGQGHVNHVKAEEVRQHLMSCTVSF